MRESKKNRSHFGLCGHCCSNFRLQQWDCGKAVSLLFVCWSSFAPLCCSCVLSHEAATGVGIPTVAGARGKASGGHVTKEQRRGKRTVGVRSVRCHERHVEELVRNVCEILESSENTDDEESDTKVDWKRFIKPKQSHKERKKRRAANYETTLENESFKGALVTVFGGKEKVELRSSQICVNETKDRMDELDTEKK